MSISCSIFNCLFAPSFLVNSLPKSGTNLLVKVVSQFPGIRAGGLHFGQSTANEFNRLGSSKGSSVPIGIDWPQLVPITVIEEAINKLKRGQYVTAHIPFSELLTNLLAETGMKTLLIFRDPRDVTVSHAYYVARSPRHFLFEYYQDLSVSERIMKSIVGIESDFEESMLFSIRERIQSVLGWFSTPINYSTRFEKLVGPRGGGSHSDQIEEISNIARHLDIKIGASHIKRIAAVSFGGTSTFRKGRIGGWRDYFSEDHIKSFKELAGDLLIELGYEKDLNW